MLRKPATAATEPGRQIGTEIPFKSLAIALAHKRIPGAVGSSVNTVTDSGYIAFVDRVVSSTAVVDTKYEITVPVDVFKSGTVVHRGQTQYYVYFYESDRGSGIRVYSRNPRGRLYVPEMHSNADQVFYHSGLDAVKSVLSRESGQLENNFIRLARIAGKLVISAIINNEKLSVMHAATEPAGAGDAVDRYLQQNHRGSVSIPGYRKFDFATESGTAILSWDRKPVVTFGTYYLNDGKRRAPACLGLFQALHSIRQAIPLEDVLERTIQNHPGATPQQIVLKILKHALDTFDVQDWDKQPQRYRTAEAAAEKQPDPDSLNHASTLPEHLRNDRVFVSLYNLKQLEGKTLSTAGRTWRITVNRIYRGHDHANDDYARGHSDHVVATLTLTAAGHDPEKIRIETWGKGTLAATYTVTVSSHNRVNQAKAIYTFRNKDFKDPVTPNSFLQTVLKNLGLLDQDQVQVPAAKVPKAFLDQCVLGYIKAALAYTQLSTEDDADEDTYSEKYGPGDVDDAGVTSVRGYMLKFLEHMYPRIEKAQFYNRNLEPSDVGHCTYLSHVGYGGGFNEERYHGDDDDLADDLDKAADAIFPGDCNLSENEDGTVSIDL